MRYDELRFKVFDKSNSSGLTTNRFTCLNYGKVGSNKWLGASVQALGEDTRGRLWVGDYSTLYSQAGEKLVAAAGWTEQLSAVKVIQDRRGGLWVGTSHFLAKLEHAGWTYFTTSDSLPGNDVKVSL